MKKFKSFFSLLIISLLIISILFSTTHVNAKLIMSDDTELNWYFVNRKDGNTPEAPKESVDFFQGLDSYYVGDTSNKVIYLTFDQGYENGNTNKILDILKEENVTAAFFVVKPYLKTEGDIVKRMVEEGHLVCNHSANHPSMASINDEEKFKNEFIEVEEEFKTITGQDISKFFRPPMGKYSKKSLERTKSLGYKTIFWSFAYKDWLVDNQPDEATAIKRITEGAHPGCIMLLHSVSTTNTKVLKTVIQNLKADGYEFKSLNEL